MKANNFLLALATALVCIPVYSGNQLVNAAGLTIVDAGESEQQAQSHPKRRVRPHRRVLNGSTAKSNTQKVNSIRWHSNLNSALGEAHRKNKMVLWVHMIGKIGGAT